MKTSLLFIIALFLGFSVFAQQNARFTPVNKKVQTIQQLNRIEPEYINTAVMPAYVPHTTKGSNMDVKKVFMGTSVNAFTLLVQEQQGIAYNKSLNAIMGSFRGNPTAVTGLPAPLGTGNDVVTSWSTDMGATFTNKLSLVGTTVLRCRYPSGVIYNPAGNTDLNNAYSLVAGPVTNGAGWTNTFMSSVQYNGNNLDKDYIPVGTNGELVRQGLTSCTDGTAHLCTNVNANDGTNYTVLKGLVKKAVFNTNTLGYDWTEQILAPDPFFLTAGLPEGTTYANMAWSKDGSVGYFMEVGVDSRAGATKGYYPIIYKSVDQGTSWQLMDYFDFSVFPVVADHIWPTLANASKYVPNFGEADMVVDGTGNLHIMALCKGAYSQHPDSLGYTYKYENGSIFEFSNEQGGTWFCHYIDHPKTRAVAGADSPYVTVPAPNVGWDMRLQASATDDGSKVFAVWTDTDWAFWGMTDSLNLYPDVMAWGRDLNTNHSTVTKNITYLQEGMGESHFMFVSPVAMDNAGVYDVPVRISDINTSSLNADLPVAHYYLQGVTFVEADFIVTGNKNNPVASTMKVTNYPNPFSGTTKINVDLDKSAPVSLVVNSLTGQQVSSVNFGTMGAGSQTLTFDASNLSSGVYFYTLTVGDQKATNKMVIK
ncbi:MAG: T9SS type A sorting domain-containing protein [Bacteroidota bacterium]